MLQSASPPLFASDVQPDRERVIVSFSGELDIASVPQAWTTLEELLEAGFSKVTVDLRDLTFLDSTGLRLLVSASRMADELGCELTLVAGPEAVQRAFTLSALDTVFTFEHLALSR